VTGVGGSRGVGKGNQKRQICKGMRKGGKKKQKKGKTRVGRARMGGKKKEESKVECPCGKRRKQQLDWKCRRTLRFILKKKERRSKKGQWTGVWVGKGGKRKMGQFWKEKRKDCEQG